jgi:hypothetical protein
MRHVTPNGKRYSKECQVIRYQDMIDGGTPLSEYEAIFSVARIEAEKHSFSFVPRQIFQHERNAKNLDDMIVADLIFSAPRCLVTYCDWFRVSDTRRIREQLIQFSMGSPGILSLEGLEGAIWMKFQLNEQGLFSFSADMPAPNYDDLQMARDPDFLTKSSNYGLSFSMRPPIAQVQKWIDEFGRLHEHLNNLKKN